MPLVNTNALFLRANPSLSIKEQLLLCSREYFKLSCIYGGHSNEEEESKLIKVGILRNSLFFVQIVFAAVSLLLWCICILNETDDLSTFIGSTNNLLVIHFVTFVVIHLYANSDSYYRLHDMLTNDLEFQFEDGGVFFDRSDRVRFVASVMNASMLISAIFMFLIPMTVTLVTGHADDYPRVFILRLDILFDLNTVTTRIILRALGNVLFTYTVLTFRNGLFISMYCTFLCVIGGYKRIHDKLKNLNVSDVDQTKIDLVKCIEQHNVLIR